MNKRNIVISCCVSLFSIVSVSAQQPLRLSQVECRKMALSHSEELQQADNKLRQAELDRKIAKRLFCQISTLRQPEPIYFPIWI